MVRSIFIGDIHGCIDEFQELVDKVNPQSEDRVICLGDFMDKGPYPADCVKFARERGLGSILGNHEERHVRWRKRVERARRDPSFKNEMRPLSDEDQRANEALSTEDIDWFKQLPVMLLLTDVRSLRDTTPGIVAVHGGLFPKTSLERQDLTKVLRARWVDDTGQHVPVDYDAPDPVPQGAVHWATLYEGKHHVVYGHEAHSLSIPRVDYRPGGIECYGIDTGCVHGGRLTAMVWERNRLHSFVQVQARKVYEPTRWPIPA